MGTRQEKGIPPLYQLVDRHCEKLAEMMNSPTWRSQNPGAHLVNPSVKFSASVISNDHQGRGPITSEEGIYDDVHDEHELEDDNFSIHVPSSSSGTTLVDEVQLSRDSEVVRLIGLHPFLKTPDGTYILSAATSSNASSPRDASHGEMWRVKLSQRRIGTRSEPFKESERPPTGAGREDSGDDCIHIKTKSEELEDDARELMKQDEAIRSISHSLRPGRCQVRATSPDEKQRFGGILERLRNQRSAQRLSDNPSLGDPAVIAFAPQAEDSTDVTMRSEHERSDSGYASQRRERGSSGASSTEAFKVQHLQGGSNDSGYESPSKNSTLNPAAKEFSSGSKRSSPVKPSVFPRPAHIDSKFWFPPPLPPGLAVLNPPCLNDPISNPIQPPWYSPMANANPSLIPFGAAQSGLLPPFPSTLTPPGLGIPGPVPSLASFTGLGLSPGHCQPCVHGSIPGLAAPCYHGPFHQQMPSLMTCNNPTHQGLPSFNPPVVAPPLQAPPAITTLPVHVAAPAQASPGTVSLPKHVPKPKVPNTTGQQNWELMHELRRTHEPGYALKCKEKQKKRHLKQLEKTGGSGA